MGLEAPQVSIIVPVVALNAHVRELVEEIRKNESSIWELVIVTNEPESDEWHDPRISIIPSGKVGPGVKRDLAAGVAQGQLLAFLDDDSYPSESWLTNLINRFTHGANAVGGPNLTAPGDTLWQRVSGAVYLSSVSGGAANRFRPVGTHRTVVDWPTVNLSVRKSVFFDVGGFDCDFWPGEDTYFCDKLTRNGYAITYDPSVQVFHHRRSGFLRHLSQAASYGFHRGNFARLLGASSRRWWYFIPSLFVIAVVLAAPVAILFPFGAFAVVIGSTLYLAAVVYAFFEILRFEGLRVAVLAVSYIPATHVAYGLAFLAGFAKKNQVKSKLRS